MHRHLEGEDRERRDRAFFPIPIPKYDHDKDLTAHSNSQEFIESIVEYSHISHSFCPLLVAFLLLSQSFSAPSEVKSEPRPLWPRRLVPSVCPPRKSVRISKRTRWTGKGFE